MKRFQLIKKLRVDGKLGDFLEIADDLMLVNQAYAEVLLKRYKDDPRASFVTGSDQKEMREWIIGQRLFQSFLNQWRIPYVHDEPVFKFECEKLFFADFIIPYFGTVEIKTRPCTTDTMIVKKAVWDRYVKAKTIPDYVVALRLESENIAEIMGYEHGSEIEKLPNAPHICIYKPCYSEPYVKLHSSADLIEALKKCTIKENPNYRSMKQTTLSERHN